VLAKNGWNVLGSAGTTSYLKEHGIACKDAADTVGPPILGHRVVTLSREIYAGLLSSTKEDLAELERLHISPIDLVYVNLYPLEQETKNPQATPASVLEKTDIGGPTLLRAAAKGRRLALSNPEQIAVLESWFSRGCLESEREEIALQFAAAAERRVADYVEASANYWEKV
ncbi:MAG: bifunctional phosphoribosylaminoimidazolecarboxamide formyltransferase/IMP cyclohydrolase, partial [bacterium]|nr:bifunctional phosphoribosylaminoimidazolecarboxamide formyltransferase/IMP cyclohydrolase [bacterium]